MDQLQSAYETIPFRDESFPIRVLLDLKAAAPDAVSEPITWHEQIEILYVLEGELTCRCGLRQHICGSGDIVIFNPCEAHAVSAHRSPARYHCLMIDLRLCGGKDDISVRRYIEPVNGRQVRFRSVIRNDRARAFLDALLDEYRAAEPGYELAVKGIFLSFLALLFRQEVSEEPGRKKSGYDTIAPALRYMADHYAEEITLAELAAACCMNRSYFCRQFHELTGRTAIAYLNEYRLAKAKAMLLTTSCSISEAAAATGFSDNGYFTRKFRELYGVPPRTMRRAISVPDHGGH